MEAATIAMMRKIEDEHWWFVARRKILANVLRSLNLPAQCEILEVGCGTGGNLDMLSTYGTVTAVEADDDAARIASDRGTAPVAVGQLPKALPDLGRDFDLICLFDVIEHVEDDAGSLQTLRKLLKHQGRILMTVPAFPFLWSQHDEENRHFRRYRRPGVRALVAKSGLKLDYVSYFNFWLFPPVAAVRVFRKIVPYKESWEDMRKPGEPVNSLLKTLFASERHLVGKMSLPFGISLIAIISD